VTARAMAAPARAAGRAGTAAVSVRRFWVRRAARRFWVRARGMRCAARPGGR